MALALSQLVLPLEQDEPYLYHDTTRGGFFSLLTELPGGAKRQTSHKLGDMPQVLANIARVSNVWVSQNEFFKPNRRLVNVWRLPLQFIDLDTYNVPSLVNLGPDRLCGHVLQACLDEGLPEPSLMVYSGRGLQIKWVLEAPAPSKAVPRWQAVQDELCRRLASLGADPKARDVSRVLRLVDTVNSKSGERVRIVHRAVTPTMGGVRREDGLIVYPFDGLADTVLPHTRQEMEALNSARADEKQRWADERSARDALRAELTVVSGGRVPQAGKSPNLRQFVRSQLAWDRIADIRKLVSLRGHCEGLPSGERNLPVFLCAVFLAEAKLVRDIRPELEVLAAEFAPAWTEADVHSSASTVMKRAEAAARGETVTFRGREVSLRYWYRNDTLLALLGITADEERQLGTIISKDEKRRRDRERKQDQRRAAGCAPRADYRATADCRRIRARELQSEGKSQVQIALELGVSPSAVRNYCCKA